MRAFCWARQRFSSIGDWECKASWSCCRTAACPGWGSRWGSSPPDAQKRAALWRRRRRCAGTAGGAAASRTCWAGWGTDSSRTPPTRTGISPGGSPRAPCPTNRRHLEDGKSKETYRIIKWFSWSRGITGGCTAECTVALQAWWQQGLQKGYCVPV